MHFLVDLDNTLLDTFYRDENGDFQFYWVDTFEADFGKPRSIFADLFNREFLTALQNTTELADFVNAFIKKHDLGITSEQLLEYWLSRDANLKPEVMAWLETKKAQGHSLHIASNQPHVRMNYLWDNFPVWHDVFDKVFTSAKIGKAKPDIGFFEYAKNELGISYNEMCFIDDCPVNIDAAKSLGMHTILFNSIKDIEQSPYC